MASRAAEDQGHREEEQQDSNGDDDLDEEDDEAEGPAAAIAANEEEAITALADAWAEQGGSEGPPVPDVAVRGFIKEYNALIPELCPKDGTVSEAAMKVKGTKESDGNAPATMRIRLARALLRLTRIDGANYEKVKGAREFDDALWLKRCRMEVLLRGRVPPDDDTGLASEMLGEFKDAKWRIYWPQGWGAHDRYHPRAGEGRPRRERKGKKKCPHGEEGACPRCELDKEWGSPSQERHKGKARMDIGGDKIVFCDEHQVGYEEGRGCPGCEAEAVKGGKRAGKWQACDKHGGRVYFVGHCKLCEGEKGPRSKGGSGGTSNSDDDEGTGLSAEQQMKVMAKVVAKAVKGGARRKKSVVKAAWADSSSSDSDSGGSSGEDGGIALSVRKMIKDLDAEETLREMSTHYRPMDYTLSALGGHAAHWGEDFNTKRGDNEDIRKEVMAMARKVKGEKDAKKLTRMAEKLKHMKNRWADNHEHMWLCRYKC